MPRAELAPFSIIAEKIWGYLIPTEPVSGSYGELVKEKLDKKTSEVKGHIWYIGRIPTNTFEALDSLRIIGTNIYDATTPTPSLKGLIAISIGKSILIREVEIWVNYEVIELGISRLNTIYIDDIYLRVSSSTPWGVSPVVRVDLFADYVLPEIGISKAGAATAVETATIRRIAYGRAVVDGSIYNNYICEIYFAIRGHLASAEVPGDVLRIDCPNRHGDFIIHITYDPRL